MKKKRKRILINKIRNEREATNTTDIKRIVRNYYEQLHAKKLDNLGEMDKFLETSNLLKLNQKEAENLNRPITTSEIEAVIKLLGHKSFTGKFYQTFKEELTLILKLFQKIQEEGRLTNSFYTTSIILIPKPGKLQANISDEQEC